MEKSIEARLIRPLSSESFVFSPVSKNMKTEIYKTLILTVVLYGYELGFSC
jgi:hypothetical protein